MMAQTPLGRGGEFSEASQVWGESISLESTAERNFVTCCHCQHFVSVLARLLHRSCATSASCASSH